MNCVRVPYAQQQACGAATMREGGAVGAAQACRLTGRSSSRARRKMRARMTAARAAKTLPMARAVEEHEAAATAGLGIRWAVPGGAATLFCSE